MKKIGFYLVKLWTAVLSFHPFWLLYLKSDFNFLLVYHVFRYRRKVVRENLFRSFPDKDLKQIKSIERKFYHNLCDLLVEGTKMMRLESGDIQNRVVFANPELIAQLYEQQRSLIYVCPHSGNWEWFLKLMTNLSQHKSLSVYKKVKSPVFDQLVYFLRTKGCDIEMVETSSTLKRLEGLSGTRNAVLMVADQTPRGVDTDYWTEFLHQDTCWYTGLDRIARRFDYAVVFVAMKRTGRGRYEVAFELITDHPKETEEDYIIEQYVRCVERFIKGQPDNWLWSHRRWKHQRPRKEKA